MKQDFSNGTSSVVYGEVEQKKFGLAMGSKIFSILSDKLYSDKILAPIRELICNARDSHVEAGTTNKKFIVHLPTRKEPYFSVRDFGTGLTHEEVINLYTVYGMTTKDDTNKAIGCWGLGSKSPFAYTDRFEVYSYKDGTLNVYQCLMTDGVPTVTKFDTCTTTEPNGLEVKFDVRSEDFENFRTRLRKMVFLQRYMDVDYEHNYNYNFPKEPERKGDVYDFQESDYGSFLEDDLSVEMGGVIYRVPYTYGQSNVLDSFTRKTSKRVIIHAELGAVDITTSREQLDMTDKTYAYLNKTLSQFMDGILNRIMAEIEAEPDALRKLLRYEQLNKTYGSFAYICRLDRRYRKLRTYVASSLSITTVKPFEDKSRKSYIVTEIEKFGSLCEDILQGQYPIFVDCSSKHALPPEIRIAANALKVDIHCIRDARTLAVFKRFNIPIHALEEYKEYKPVRTYCGGGRKKEDKKPGELIRAGLSAKVHPYSLDAIARAYSEGEKIWWCGKDELEDKEDAEKVLKHLGEPLNDSCYCFTPSVYAILNNVAFSNEPGVVATSEAAKHRALEDPLFVHLPTKIKEFLSNGSRIKKVVEYELHLAAKRKFEGFLNYGKDFCDLVYKHLVNDKDAVYEKSLWFLPYVKRVFSGKVQDTANPPNKMEREIINHLISYKITAASDGIYSSMRRYISEKLTLVYYYIDRTELYPFPLWGHQTKEVEEDMKVCIKAAVKRLRQEQKEKQVVSTNEENKENKEKKEN